MQKQNKKSYCENGQRKLTELEADGRTDWRLGVGISKIRYKVVNRLGK